MKKLLGQIRYYFCRLFWKKQGFPLFWYYGSFQNQLEETKGHVDIYHVCPWEGDVCGKVKAAGEAGLQVMLTGPDAGHELIITLEKLSKLDLLKYVKYLYVQDEPNLGNAPNIRAVKSLVKQFEFDPKYVVIYSGQNSNYIDIEEYDFVGVDDYYAKEGVLNTKVLDLRKRLNDRQKLVLVPGGCSPYRQDPTPFYKRAMEDDKIGMVCAFTWFDPQVPDRDFSAGIRSNGMADFYRGLS